MLERSRSDANPFLGLMTLGYGVGHFVDLVSTNMISYAYKHSVNVSYIYFGDFPSHTCKQGMRMAASLTPAEKSCRGSRYHRNFFRSSMSAQELPCTSIHFRTYSTKNSILELRSETHTPIFRYNNEAAFGRLSMP
jgi:hypothetical protein